MHGSDFGNEHILELQAIVCNINARYFGSAEKAPFDLSVGIKAQGQTGRHR
jgi:hypothetical protein